MKQAKKKHPRRHTAQRTRAAEETGGGFAKAILKAQLITAGFGLALLVIASLIAYFTPHPLALVRPLGITASLLTALACGFCTARIYGHAALLCGLLGGGCTMLLLMLCSLLMQSYASGYPAWLSCLFHSAFLLCSVLGAYLALRHPQKRRR